MNILLIGNGFDLEHNLPTSYKDFLEFCERARRIYTLHENTSVDDFIKTNLHDWKMDDSIKKTLSAAFKKRKCQSYKEDGCSELKVITQNKALDEMYTHIKENVWLEYFLNCDSYAIGKNWIDFETEISRVIQALDSARFQIKSGDSAQNTEKREQKILMLLPKVAKGSLRNMYGDTDAIDNFVGYLNKELERLIRALEIYIAEFVGKIIVTKKSIDIEGLNPDHILSFNYSDTYERVYGEGKKIKYDYIHGKADITN
ncbi:AbiH family protein [Faecalimonas sp. LCP19S3_D12]